MTATTEQQWEERRKASLAKSQDTTARVYEAIARSLREFGYPDADAAMIADTHRAQLNRAAGIDTDTPHGIVGMFAERQLDEAREKGLID